jgi:hypothetical protein
MNTARNHPGGRRPDGSSDRRWVIVVEDGRYSTLGRATDPTATEIREAEDGLRAQGLAGWLAVMSGSPYGPRLPTLMEVQPLASPRSTWAAASSACLAAIAAQRGENRC